MYFENLKRYKKRNDITRPAPVKTYTLSREEIEKKYGHIKAEKGNFVDVRYKKRRENND